MHLTTIGWQGHGHLLDCYWYGRYEVSTIITSGGRRTAAMTHRARANWQSPLSTYIYSLLSTTHDPCKQATSEQRHLLRPGACRLRSSYLRVTALMQPSCSLTCRRPGGRALLVVHLGHHLATLEAHLVLLALLSVTVRVRVCITAAGLLLARGQHGALTPWAAGHRHCLMFTVYTVYYHHATTITIRSAPSTSSSSQHSTWQLAWQDAELHNNNARWCRWRPPPASLRPAHTRCSPAALSLGHTTNVKTKMSACLPLSGRLRRHLAAATFPSPRESYTILHPRPATDSANRMYTACAVPAGLPAEYIFHIYYKILLWHDLPVHLH